MNQMTLNPQTYVRSLTNSDALDLFNLINSNRDYLSKWLGWVGNTKAIEDAASFIEYANKLGENGSVTLAIFYQNKLAGLCCYHPIDFKNKKADLGYWIGEEFSGNQLATMATKYLITNAFSNLGLNKVGIMCATENMASRKIAEKLGLKLDGILRCNEIVGDKIYNHAAYSIIKNEWI